MRGFSALPDAPSDSNFCFQRRNQGDPCGLADEQGSLAEKIAFQQMSGVRPHPPGPRLVGQNKLGALRHNLVRLNQNLLLNATVATATISTNSPRFNNW